MVTMSPTANRVLPVFGVQQYFSTEGPISAMDRRYLAFLGNGDAEAHESLCVASPVAVSTTGMWDSMDAATEQPLETVTVYADQLAPTALLLLTTGYAAGNMARVLAPLFLEVEYVMVHVYSDAPHPFAALKRVQLLESLFRNHTNVAAFDMHKYWLKRACHEGQAGGASALAFSWKAPSFFGDSALLKSAQARHNLLLPPVQAGGGGLPQASGLAEQQVRGWAKEEMDRRRSSDATTKGCRKVKKEEVTRHMPYTGLDPDTADKKDGPAFILKWEEMPSRESAMRAMWTSLVLKSAQMLGFSNRRIHYYHSHFIGGTIRNLGFGFCLCFSYTRSHQGFIIASIWYLRCTPARRPPS